MSLRFFGVSMRGRESHFAEGFNFCKLVLLFVIGSFLGFVLETVWCCVTLGRLQSRSSLLFSPLIIVYGLGTLAMYIGFYKVNKGNLLLVFSLGFLLGSVVEYLSSWALELFGLSAWDYSKEFLNIDGRICLKFSLMWGALAVAWVIFVQPILEYAISKIPNRLGKPLVIGLVVVLTVNVALSIVALSRWAQRMEGEPAKTEIAGWLDSVFPDQYMERAYPALKFRTNDKKSHPNTLTQPPSLKPMIKSLPIWAASFWHKNGTAFLRNAKFLGSTHHYELKILPFFCPKIYSPKSSLT